MSEFMGHQLLPAVLAFALCEDNIIAIGERACVDTICRSISLGVIVYPYG
jgi:hypothetical protein